MLGLRIYSFRFDIILPGMELIRLGSKSIHLGMISLALIRSVLELLRLDMI